MTPERLAEIKERLYTASVCSWGVYNPYPIFDATAELIAEVERLRGIEEAARRLRNNAMQSGECEPGRIDVQPMDFAWLCARLNAVSPEKPAAPPTNTENK